MRSGQLRHRIIIEEPIETKGSMGGTTRTWIQFYTCWGDVRELSGRELLQSDQIQSRILGTCFIRYKSGIDATMRLRHEDKVYQIESVINKDGKNAMLELPLYEFR